MESQEKMYGGNENEAPTDASFIYRSLRDKDGKSISDYVERIQASQKGISRTDFLTGSVLTGLFALGGLFITSPGLPHIAGAVIDALYLPYVAFSYICLGSLEKKKRSFERDADAAKTKIGDLEKRMSSGSQVYRIYEMPAEFRDKIESRLESIASLLEYQNKAIDELKSSISLVSSLGLIEKSSPLLSKKDLEERKIGLFRKVAEDFPASEITKVREEIEEAIYSASFLLEVKDAPGAPKVSASDIENLKLLYDAVLERETGKEIF